MNNNLTHYLSIAFIAYSSAVFSQTWNQNGNNHSTGDLAIGSTSGDGVISINNSVTGKKTLDMINVNANIYFTDHSLSFVSNPGWSQVPYIQWYVPNGNRQAYLGWQRDYFNLTLENGYNFSINGGNVGIGTSDPIRPLHVEGDIYANGLFFGKYGGSLSGDPDPYMLSSQDGVGEHDLLVFGNGGGSTLNLRLYDGSLKFGWSANPNAQINNNGSAFFNGNIGIGTQNLAYALNVNGTIRSQEVKVEAAPWPDYVFKEEYNLASLEEIEAFIQSSGHLPEIPSAAEMEAEGLKLGEMNRLLLKKIEELTLYTIEQEKKIDNYQLVIKNLIERLEKLEEIQK